MTQGIVLEVYRSWLGHGATDALTTRRRGKGKGERGNREGSREESEKEEEE